MFLRRSSCDRSVFAGARMCLNRVVGHDFAVPFIPKRKANRIGPHILHKFGRIYRIHCDSAKRPVHRTRNGIAAVLKGYIVPDDEVTFPPAMAVGVFTRILQGLEFFEKVITVLLSRRRGCRVREPKGNCPRRRP